MNGAASSGAALYNHKGDIMDHATALENDTQNAIGNAPSKPAVRRRPKKKVAKRTGSSVGTAEVKALREKIASLELVSGMERRSRAPHTSDMPIDQDEDFKAGKIYVIKGTEYKDKALWKNQMDALEFNEEPVTIRIGLGTGENPDPVVPFVAVNGVGAEVRMADGKWASLGYFPREVDIITKRKYVAVLAQAKIETIRTQVTQKPFEDAVNGEKRVTSGYVALTLVRDDNLIGHAWLANLRARKT